MKYILSITVVLLFASITEAQVVAQQIDSLINSSKSDKGESQSYDAGKLKKLNSYKTSLQFDSINVNKFIFKDSTKQKEHRKRNRKVNLKAQKADSVKNVKLTKVDSVFEKSHIVDKKQHDYVDSLNQINDRYQSQIKEKTSSLTGVVDSLNSLNPLGKVNSKLDSINTLNKKPSEALQKSQALINKPQEKIQQVQNSTAGKVDEKLSILSKEAEGQGNLPGGINLPDTDLGLGKILPDDLKTTDLNINSKALSMDQPTIPGNALDKKLDVNTDISKGLETQSKSLDKSLKFDETDKLLKNKDEVSNLTDKGKGYTTDIKNIKEGDLDKVATAKEEVLSKIPVSDELSEIQKQDQLIKDQRAKLESYKNPEEYKRQTLARSKQLVAVKMAVFQKELTAGINNVSKYQNKLGTVLTKTSELSKKRDKLKRLRTYEKFVPGLTLQVQSNNPLVMDLNPSLRYRLTSYWSIGSGWNERVLFDKHSYSYNQTRVFGVRSFTEVIIFKGISFRLDAETMNTSIQTLKTKDEGKRVQVWSYMVGLKKDFSFVPKIMGDVQFMYNVYASNVCKPYPTKFNVRFGFEYMANKRKKR